MKNGFNQGLIYFENLNLPSIFIIDKKKFGELIEQFKRSLPFNIELKTDNVLRSSTTNFKKIILRTT